MPEVRTLETIRKEFHELTMEVVGLRTELKGFKETVENIFSIIYGDGSGTAITTKVALNSSEIESIRSHIKEKADINDITDIRINISEIKEDIKNIKKDKIALLTATISGCLGLIGAIFVAVIQFLKK